MTHKRRSSGPAAGNGASIEHSIEGFECPAAPLAHIPRKQPSADASRLRFTGDCGPQSTLDE
jgi:hypothetical protein